MTELPEYKLEERDFSIPNVQCYELTFKGTRNGLVYSRMILPKTDHKVPVIFHFHGLYGTLLGLVRHAGLYSSWLWCCVYGRKRSVRFSTDGDRSPLGNTVKGQIIRGAVEGPDELFYKDIYLDLYQLIEIVANLPQVDDSKLASYGASQVVPWPDCCWIKSRIQRTVAIYPFLSDFRRVLEIGNTSEAYDELFRYFKFHDPFQGNGRSFDADFGLY